MQFFLNSGDSLTAVLSGAATTTNPTARVEYHDGGHPRIAATQLSGATAVTLLAGSGVTNRVVSEVSIYNIDTAAVTVTLAHSIAGTSHTVLKLTLQVGDTIVVNASGVRVTDSSGQIKQSGVSTATEEFAIPFGAFRVHDAIASNLPATSSADDMGLVVGTDGTAFASLRTADFKATTASVLGRAFFVLPSNYSAGSAITLRIRGGMITTVSDGTCTVDASVYSNDGDATGSADLVETAAVSINSLTFADKDFTITPTGLVAGQQLNIKLTIAGSDTATGTAVIGALSHVAIRTSVSR